MTSTKYIVVRQVYERREFIVRIIADSLITAHTFGIPNFDSIIQRT